jgi:hypothetical protein
MVIVLFFLSALVLRPTGHSYFSGEHWQAITGSIFRESAVASGQHSTQTTLSPAAGAYLVFVYFVSMFLATFFNVAFYNEIIAALRGQPVSIGRGLRFACTKWKSVLLWTLFAGLVGLIIKAIEERLAFVGQIIARFIGLAWSIASVFVIPIIVREEQTANPLKLLQHSAGILKRTWGEALIGYVGLAFANTLILIVSAVGFLITMFVSISLNNYWILGGAGAVWLVALFAWAYLTSVASHIYKGALYLYAAEGVIAEPYNQEMLEMAWKYKQR